MFRFVTRTTKRLVDIAILVLFFWLAFLARFEGEIPVMYLKRALLLCPYVVILQYGVMALWGIPNYSWQYTGLREVNRIFVALASASGILLAVRLIAPQLPEIQTPVHYALVPIGVIIINFTLSFLGIVGVRVLRRLVKERLDTVRRPSLIASSPTILVGAGDAGVMVAKEIHKWPSLGFVPIGFVDDEPGKLGMLVHGLRVLGTTDDLEELVVKHGIDQCVITIANAPGQQIRRISEKCEEIGIGAKIIPAIFELLDGTIHLNRIRDVSIEDLLRREVAQLDSQVIHRLVSGKNVLVTGAGGSIGAEICRQVLQLKPRALLLLERAEQNLFSIHSELSRLDGEQK